MADLAFESEQAERAEDTRKFLQYASSIYVTPLFLFFSIADYIWFRNYFLTFFIIRLITSFGSAMLIRAFVGRAAGHHIEWLGTLFLAFCFWSIHLMIFIIGDASTPYYAGLVLVLLGYASGLRMSWPFYGINIAQAILPYLTFGALYSRGLREDYFYLNATFILSMAIILTVSRWFTERLHRTARDLREQLNNEIISRDQVIAQKTAEALELHALSRQFSPQIISALSKGGLHLVDKVHSAEICTVFVDIVSSTNRLCTLKSDDLQRILAMYMEDVMGIFLKYDITIDKFLGDGVLAFSNDPIPYPDYIERVIRAALETRHRILSRRDEYMKYWAGEFEISFGIATGSASVGFYGSDLHVKSYTAIGRVVNLAARLGSLAGPNEILVSGDVLEKLKDVNSELLGAIEIGDKGAPTLKGFENQRITVHSIDSSRLESDIIPIGDVERCPQGHGLLFLAQDQNGIYFFRCRHCDYVLSESQAASKAA